MERRGYLQGRLHVGKGELEKGPVSLVSYFLNNGLNGMYPSVGAATSIEVPTSSLRKYAQAKLSWIDGGNTDNYGIGALLHNMQESGTYHPIMVLLTMGYNSISKYFSYKHNGEPNSDEARGFVVLLNFR